MLGAALGSTDGQCALRLGFLPSFLFFQKVVDSCKVLHDVCDARTERDPIPFDVQALFGGSQKTVQRFTLAPTPAAHAHAEAWLPRRGFSLCVPSRAPHGRPGFTLPWWQKEEVKPRNINGPELSEGPGKRGCGVAFQRGQSRAGRAWLKLTGGDRPFQRLGAQGCLSKMLASAETEPSGHPMWAACRPAWVCFELLAAVLSSLLLFSCIGLWGVGTCSARTGVWGAAWGSGSNAHEREGRGAAARCASLC